MILLAENSTGKFLEVLFNQALGMYPVIGFCIPLTYLVYLTYEDIVTTGIERKLRTTRKRFFSFIFKTLLVCIIGFVAFFMGTFLQVLTLLDSFRKLTPNDKDMILSEYNLKIPLDILNLDISYNFIFWGSYLGFFILIFVSCNLIFLVLKVFEFFISIKYSYFVEIENELWKIINVNNKNELITEKSEVIQILSIDDYRKFYRFPADSSFSLIKQNFYKDRKKVNIGYGLAIAVTIISGISFLFTHYVLFLILGYSALVCLLLMFTTIKFYFSYEK